MVIVIMIMIFNRSNTGGFSLHMKVTITKMNSLFLNTYRNGMFLKLITLFSCTKTLFEKDETVL